MSKIDKNVTLLVNSCDLYEDTWEPFFRLLKIQWPEFNYDVVLNTENKVYKCDFLNVKTICGGEDKTWSERLKAALKEIHTEFILFSLEDFFLKEKVDNEAFEAAHTLIQNDDSVGYIGLKYNSTYKFKDENKKVSNEPFISKDELCRKRMNCNFALWRRDWLIGLIRDHETPWEFEQYVGIRSLRTGKKALQINNNIFKPVFVYDVDIEYGYGITLKKWLPKNKELFEKYGIEVNFDNLGFLDYSVFEKKESASLKEDFTLRERLYLVKKQIKKIPKKIKKKYRKIKSLI